MIVPILFVGHAGLGLLALGSAFLPEKWRRRILLFLCLLGIGAGVAIAVLGVQGDTWRSTELGDTAVIAGAATALAWLVAVVVAALRGRALSCALVGVAAASLTIAATSRWMVPVLLFWVCSSVALAGLAARGERPAPIWIALFLSDACLIAALVGVWVDERTWTLPTELDGWTLYVLLAAAAIRGGAIPALGVWGSLSGAAAPAAPLLTGGAFTLLPIALGPGAPWAAAVLFALAIGAALWALSGSELSIPAGAAAPLALLLGAVVVAPDGLVAGGLAVVFTASVLALWRVAWGLGGADRSVALTALPPWVGFTAIAGGAGAAIEELAAARDVIDKVPWTLVVILGPAALAASVAVAARASLGAASLARWLPVLRRGRPNAIALLASRVVLVAGLAAGMVPGEWLGIDSDFAGWLPRRTILFGAAILLGLGAAWLTSRRIRFFEPQPISLDWTAPAPQPDSTGAKILVWATLALAVGAIGTVGWFTFEGLRLGFL
ncbi:MAG TPA: hypothetical protein VEV82_06035 [Actinomycetota bacterium]|nr:hypothetical protein [Actinomycetota bacterium]